MDRRKFLIGVGGASIGGSALLGSGAFSRVESQRDVTIQVAKDPDAYLGLDGTGSVNSDNYVDLDENGHLAIDISESGNDGEGVNSDSFTWFDSMVQVCNQGKEAVGFYIEEPTDEDFPSGIEATGSGEYDDEPRLQFYTGEAAGVGDGGTTSVMSEDNAVDIPLGECIELGVRTMTKGVDANEETLFGDEVVLIADVDVDTDLGRQENPVRNARTRDGYDSIQAAIDDAEEGDTIEVLTGTEFEEDVDITVDGLTLVATSNAKPIIKGQVDLVADGAVLDGFEVSPSDPATGTLDNEAILIGASDVSVLNNTVTDFQQDFGGFGELIGIVASNTDETPIENVLISGNEVTGLQPDTTEDVAAVGISIAGNVDATVEANHVSDIGGDQAYYAWGIVARKTGNEVPTNVELIGNTIESITSEDGFGERFFGVGFGWDAGSGTGADSMSATNNSIETPELIVENKDPNDEIDATANWWGDSDGPEEERIAGEEPRRQEVEELLDEFDEERGSVDTSSPLGSPPS